MTRAQARYDSAKAACKPCTPRQQSELEMSRVLLALMRGQERDRTLAASVRAATQLERTHPVVAANLFAWLGRWRAPELLERAARALAHVEPSAGADSQAVLSVLLTDPEFVQHSELGRTWPVRYELQSYHWQAPSSSVTRDDRYDLAACQSPANRMGRIPDFGQQFSSLYALYHKCDGGPEPQVRQSTSASVSFRLMTDSGGTVTRIDLHATFLRVSQVHCLGEILRHQQWGTTRHGGIEEVNISFEP